MQAGGSARADSFVDNVGNKEIAIGSNSSLFKYYLVFTSLGRTDCSEITHDALFNPRL